MFFEICWNDDGYGAWNGMMWRVGPRGALVAHLGYGGHEKRKRGLSRHKCVGSRCIFPNFFSLGSGTDASAGGRKSGSSVQQAEEKVCEGFSQVRKMAAMAGTTAVLGRSEILGQSFVAAPSTSVRTSSPFQVVALFGKKGAAPKKAAKSAKAAPPANAELAKWYGPDRRIYLPEGLLDKSEIPAYLTGEVPGDYGFDPFGLSKKPADFDKYQAYELIHARWAMLGAAGFVLPEAFNKYGAVCGPEAVWFKTGALLLEGNTLQYFGATIPVNLAAAVIAEVILVGGAEYYRSTNKSPLGSDLDRLHPGGAFDPLGLAKDPDQFALLKVKEIKNGRLAMFSMLGFFIQAYVTGEGPVENLAAHLSDPFGNNLLTVLQGGAERAPSL